MSKRSSINRRQFLSQGAAALGAVAAGPLIVPRRVYLSLGYKYLLSKELSPTWTTVFP